MPNKWFTADPCFSDTYGWSKNLDPIVKTEFASVEDRDATIVENWNACVKPNDTIYVLGNVGFCNEKLHAVLPRLNGTKRLILGVHDHWDRFDALQAHFKKVFLIREFDAFVCSHIPLMKCVMRFKTQVCVHGHLHRKIMRVPFRLDKDTPPDPNYLNICIENTGYKPVSIDLIHAAVSEQRKKLQSC